MVNLVELRCQHRFCLIKQYIFFFLLDSNLIDVLNDISRKRVKSKVLSQLIGPRSEKLFSFLFLINLEKTKNNFIISFFSPTTQVAKDDAVTSYSRKGCYCFTWKLLRWRDANNVSPYRLNNSNLWFLLLLNFYFPFSLSWLIF